MASDRTLRSIYAFWVLADAMVYLRTRPTRAELLQEIESHQRALAGKGVEQPEDQAMAKPGFVLGRLTSMLHNMIYNYELSKEEGAGN